MLEKKIIVIGGSIAGCTTAILLKRLGADVVVLERSAGLVGKGSGVVLPEALVEQCINLNLFDANIPHFRLDDRSFTYKNEYSEHNQTTFWIQPLTATALNWASIYQNLRNRTGAECYITNTEVQNIENMGDSYLLKTSTGVTYKADLIIAADGVDSNTRAQLFPGINPEYTDYIAWRGVIDDQNLVGLPFLNEHVSYYVFPKGHILLYRIPSTNYQHTGHTLLNWVMYENRPGLSLSNLLIDRNGIQHTRSLPSGSLTNSHINYLHELSQYFLPTNIADLIIQTQKPFIQAVFDFQLPSYSNNHIIFVGDSAATLRPHTSSGVLKALKDGIELKNLFEKKPTVNLNEIILTWKEIQQTLVSEENQKAKTIGNALVTNPPNWKLMDQQSADEWWAGVIRGNTWYATSKTDRSALINNSIFPRESDKIKSSSLKKLAEIEFKRK
jgi:2-polyprenyl-6-methoxyphenol hydroxylase-like FAD-dependent oxidoreductase